MGALTLNVWACAFLYQPVEKHLVPAKIRRDEEEALEPLAEAEDLEHTEVDIAVISPDDDKRLISPTSPMSNGGEIDKIAINGGAPPTVPKSASSVALENYYKPSPQSRTRKISMPVQMASQMHSTPTLHSVPERPTRRSTVTRPPPMSPSTSSFNYISTPFHGSTLTALHPEYASTLTLNAITSTFRKSPEKQVKKDEKPPNKFFDCGLFRDPMYLVILISNSTNAISYTNFVIVLTLYATNQLKFTDEQAALLLSIISLFDLIGKHC